MPVKPVFQQQSRHFHCQPVFFRQELFREDLQRKPTISVFKDAIAAVNAHFDSRFEAGEDIRQLIYDRATFIDVILHYAWHHYEWGQDISLIAVGGYGRGELHPKSDIDLLFLLQDGAGNTYDEKLSSLVTLLWDIGLEIGSSVRTFTECIDIAKRDITVATNLMEARRIAGATSLLDELQDKTSSRYMWPLKEFFNAKWQEQEERHSKHGSSEYNLEPNIKNSPGGLRDIQTINWVSKRYFKINSLANLRGGDYFTEEEYATLHNGEEFLWRVRYGVHYITGRAEERLLFEHQRELAKRFGFKDDESHLAVEKFMNMYYRKVITLGALNDILLQYLDEKIHTQEGEQVKITPINDRFQLFNNYIEVTRPSIFDEKPSAMLEIFVIMGNNRNIVGVRAETIRLLREKRHLIDDNFRRNSENNAMFLSLFSIEYGLVTQLKRMRRYGILGRYLPEFGEIIGQMQHDLFHQYTVDSHTLLVIENIRRFTYPEEREQFPLAAQVMKQLDSQEPLLIAALFHDIAKGRGGDHSELGAIDVEKFCVQHKISRRDTRLIVWLVEKHLLMSYVSQKQDTYDPEVIQQFATTVGSQRQLDYLYALTVADMCGTNPNIWNSWRASLLSHLYQETKRALRRGLGNTATEQDIVEETQNIAIQALAGLNISRQQAESVWQNMGDEYFVRESSSDIVWQTEAILKHHSEQPLILIRDSMNQKLEGATQIFIRIKDDANVFSAVANCLAHQSLNIQDARIYTTLDGFTVDTYYVLDENYEPLKQDHKRYKKIVDALVAELSLVGEYRDVVSRRTPRQLKHFATPTRTNLILDNANGSSTLEVISPDRPGLLATIGRIFMDFNIQLQNAKISTLGERVEDIFFIVDENGQPLSDEKLCNELQREICEQIDKQIESE